MPKRYEGFISFSPTEHPKLGVYDEIGSTRAVHFQWALGKGRHLIGQ
jgi:hypothetical protein